MKYTLLACSLTGAAFAAGLSPLRAFWCGLFAYVAFLVAVEIVKSEFRLIVLLSALALNCPAATVQFAWRANLEADLAGYRLYVGPSAGFYTNAIVIPASQTNFAMAVNQPTFFALSAFDTSGLESDLTAAVAYSPEPPSVRLISERTLDGAFWYPAITNTVLAEWPIEFWRLRIERD